jgi:hypothetical protein
VLRAHDASPTVLVSASTPQSKPTTTAQRTHHFAELLWKQTTFRVHEQQRITIELEKYAMCLPALA